MASKETTIKANLTLRNGTVVSNGYARQRIVARLRPLGISLEDRRAVANCLVNDHWHQGVLVSYLESIAFATWAYPGWRVER